MGSRSALFCGTISKDYGESFCGVVPLPALHCVHSCFHVAVVAIDLLLQLILFFCQVAERILHAGHLLLPLDTFPMLAPHVTRDGIQYALETIFPRYLSHFLELEQAI